MVRSSSYETPWSMGREDPVSDAAEQASTVDTGGAGSDQLVVLEAASAQEVVTATRKNTRRMKERR